MENHFQSQNHFSQRISSHRESESDCKKFKDLVEEIADSLAKKEDKESEDGSATAGLLEKLTVSKIKSEESAKAETTESSKETETKAGATPSE